MTDGPEARIGEILNVPFNPSAEQRNNILSLPADIQKQSERLAKVVNDRLPALRKAMKDAGIEVKSGH